MLKKTLHSAVAAIAVSTMYLPVAEADMYLPVAEADKKDLVLDFESYNQYMVQKKMMVPNQLEDGTYESLPATFGDGFYEFENKTLSVSTVWRWDFQNSVSGQHVVCDAGSDLFFPMEWSKILRGHTLSNTLTLDTVAMEDSSDPTNPYASGLCSEGGQPTHFVVNHQISDATGKWSCAYTQGDGISLYVDIRTPASNPPPERPGSYISVINQMGSGFTGAIIIPRSTCQQ
jgi:hypothetical protein